MRDDDRRWTGGATEAEWARCPDDDEFGGEEPGRDHDVPESGREWRRTRGIFILAPIGGAAGEHVRAIQRRHDRKLASMNSPHVTLAGSSGVGPVLAGTTEEELRAALEPVARTTAPIELHFGPPHRFMQTNIVSLPVDPRGPIRDLFERIRGSGLRFGPVRFAFSPHATLSYFPELDRRSERILLAERVPEPFYLDRLELSLTNDPQPPKHIFELPLGGGR